MNERIRMVLDVGIWIFFFIAVSINCSKEILRPV